MSTSATPDPKELDKRCNLFGLQSYLEISWNESATTEPITPRGELRSVPLTIRFGITIKGPLGDYILRFFNGRMVQIHMNIEEYPEWCQVTMKSKTITTVISREERILDNLLTVHLDVNAPAFQEFGVVINASVATITGPLGLIGIINGCETEVCPFFRANYLPLITTDCPNGNVIEAPPGETTTLTFGVTNYGNGKTKIYNEINVTEIPEGWALYVTDSVILDVGERGLVNISVRPPYVSGQGYDEPIKVRVTPRYADNIEISGPSQNVTFLVYYHP